MINIVLVEPEIPQNTGNVARTCAATGCSLHLIEPFGFRISDKQLKRAGLDYWHLLDIKMYKNLQDFFSKNSGNFYFFSTKSKKTYTDVTYKKGDYIIFGKETKGLPEDLLQKNFDNCVRIPMKQEARSLNLANSVAVAAYEAIRQIGYDSLQSKSDYFA